ncbi:ester cyclase [[Actinomadura] parvosata]|uniref:ester cyclase n=1 Tax=[Actinomadura] parvosata TaxID=1955412 RepID=UPI001645ED5C
MSEELTPAAVVRAHSQAKTSGDITGALAWCHQDVIFETIAFQSAAHGIDAARRQFQGFLGAFPDYSVQLEDLREMDDLVLGVGRIAGTMKGPLAGVEPTGRAFDLPFVCLWYVHDGLITLERFFYDFNEMCEHLGIDTTTAANRFRTWRERADAMIAR